MKKPNLFIIGAPKCGTTSLALWLAEHPQVFMSADKEPNYFNTDIFTPKRINEHDYYGLFDDANDSHIFLGEASTRYLYSNNACKNILSICDTPKFIVIVRNPIEMIYSFHNHLSFLGVEQFKDFRVAWRKKDSRAEGHEVKNTCNDPDSLAYGKIGMLGEQVERFFKTVPKEQRLTLCFEDLKLDPERVYCEILEFLEIEANSRRDFSATNKSMAYKFGLLGRASNCLGIVKEMIGIKKGWGILALFNKWNRIDKSLQPIENDLLIEMKRYFYEDIKLLERLLERDLSHWVDGVESNDNV